MLRALLLSVDCIYGNLKLFDFMAHRQASSKCEETQKFILQENWMRRSSRSAKVLISCSRSTWRSLLMNKTARSLRRSSPVLFLKSVLIIFIAEKERSHDAEVTGRVSANWTHFIRFGKATCGVSLLKTVSRLVVFKLSLSSFFSKFNATVISAFRSVLSMSHASEYTDSKGIISPKFRNLGESGQRTDDTELTIANESSEKRRLNSLRIRSRTGIKKTEHE